MSDFYIFRNALKDLFRVKNLIAVALVALLPLGIALLWRSLAPPAQFATADVYDRIADSVIFGFVLVILACVFGTGLVSQEVEQKTIVYLLTRPVPRWRILLMKHAAALLATTVAAWVATALLLLGTGAHAGVKPHIGRDLLILPLGSLAYGGLFLLMTTLFRRPLVLGLVYTFGIETWLPGLPGNFKMLSLMAWLRVLAPHAQPDAAGDPVSGTILTPHLAWVVLVAVTLVTTACALIVFSTNEYVPRDDA